MVALKSPALVLGILGAVALAGIVFLVIRIIKAKKAGSPAPTGAVSSGLLGHVQTLLANPLVQRLVSHTVTAAQVTHHAALDAGIVKLLPAAAPFIPAINAVADKVDEKVSPAATPAPDDLTSKIAAAEKMIADLKAHFGK